MTDKQLKETAHEFVEANWDAIVEDITTMVKIRSVEDLEHAQPGMPYGPGPFKALEAGMNLAKRIGLDVHNCDGRIAYADLAGEQDKQIAVIGHTDVVAEGSGWEYEPFAVTHKDGYLIGRGVLDDKGPFVLEMYAAKFLKEQVEATGKKYPYTLRCIIGNNEETDMADVEWYVKNFEQPEFCFTPDSSFPLVCGEKGGFSASIRTADIADTIVELCGGQADNAVASDAYALVKADISTLKPRERIDIEDAGNGLVKVIGHGVSAHASTPQSGINAIGLVVDYLVDNNIGTPAEKQFLAFEQCVFGSTDGSTLTIAATDEIFDPLTCIGGRVFTEGKAFRQTIDARYPSSVTDAWLYEQVSTLAAKYDCTVDVDLVLVPFLTDPNNECIKTLVATYNEYTGREAKPFTIGGGTYARHFKAAGAFGPNDPAFPMPSWLGGEHAANEGFSVEQFKRALEIYIVSLVRIMSLDL